VELSLSLSGWTINLVKTGQMSRQEGNEKFREKGRKNQFKRPGERKVNGQEEKIRKISQEEKIRKISQE
jgi:hypothetical protein